MHTKVKNRKSSNILKEVNEASRISFAPVVEQDDDLILGFESNQENIELSCLSESKPTDTASGILFRECLIDYTKCSETRCIKKLV